MKGCDDVREKLLRDYGHIFREGGEIHVARAPGRLDVMGGIGDYSGCLVLETTIDKSTWVAVQERPDRRVCVCSAPAAREGMAELADFHLDELFPHGRPLRYDKARKLLNRDAQTCWSAYIIGALIVLAREGIVPCWKNGVSIAVWGDVPFGGGVSSSASVEMATLLALASLSGIRIGGPDISALRFAAIGQILENRIAGAPCGIMDQVTVTLGREGALLPILCRPAAVEEALLIPKEVALVGIDSHVKHSIGGSRYTDTRVATFMGHRILSELIEKRNGNFYLAEIDPDVWKSQLRRHVPQQITGKAFLRRYEKTFDRVTNVDPDKTYLVRSRTEHPIYEQRRVEMYCDLLREHSRTRNTSAGPKNARTGHCASKAHQDGTFGSRLDYLVRAGELMYASHWWYGKRCGLGCAETDLLVRLARECGPEKGIYGAKISGGGSGGTVALLIDRRAKSIVKDIANCYAAQTGHTPRLFMSGSPGGIEYGVHRVTLSGVPCC